MEEPRGGRAVGARRHGEDGARGLALGLLRGRAEGQPLEAVPFLQSRPAHGRTALDRAALFAQDGGEVAIMNRSILVLVLVSAGVLAAAPARADIIRVRP